MDGSGKSSTPHSAGLSRIQHWKKVIAIPKSGIDNVDPLNYRSISLVFHWCIESDCQSGFL